MHGVQFPDRVEVSGLPAGGKVREERLGPGYLDEVRGEAVPQEGLRGHGEDVLAPVDPRHGARRHPAGVRLAEARVHEDPPEDTLPWCTQMRWGPRWTAPGTGRGASRRGGRPWWQSGRAGARRC
jgi:hypothetical protein